MPIRRGHIAPRNVYLDTVIRKFDGKNQTFVIANAQEGNWAIIYCNDLFCSMSGFKRSELMQRSSACNFLYGSDTRDRDVILLREAILRDEETEVNDVCLYRRDGTSFRCDILIAPIKNEHGEVMMLILNFDPDDPDRKNSGKKHQRFRRIKNRLPSFLFMTTPFSKHASPRRDKKSRASNFAPSSTPVQEQLTNSHEVNCRSSLQNNRDTKSSDNIFAGQKDITSAKRFPRKLPPKSLSFDQSVKIGPPKPSCGCKSGLSAPNIGSEKVENCLTVPKENSSDKPAFMEVPGNSPTKSSSNVRLTASMTNLKSPLSEEPTFEGNSLSIISSTSDSDLLRTKKNRRSSFVEFTDRLKGGGVVQMRDKVTTTKVSEFLSMGADVTPEQKLNAPYIHKWTILHYSLFKAVWDWLILILVIYTAIFTPYSAAFSFKGASKSDHVGYNFHDPLSIVEMLVDFFFVVDIVINFRTTYVNKNEEVVSQPRKIAVHYFKGWFLIDLVAAVPFDLLVARSTRQQETTLIGLLKTARLLRLVRVARKLDRYSEFGAAVLFLLMCSFVLIAHWLACIWYAIGNMERLGLPGDIGWLSTLGNQLGKPYNNTFDAEGNPLSIGGPDPSDKYITALYFTFSSLTSVGFGNVSPNTNNEKLFSVCVMLIGALMYASIFGNVSAIIQRLYSGTARYHTQMLRVKEFVRFHQIPNPLRQRLEEYFQHAWSYSNGIDMNLVLKGFPEGLQADICLHLNRNLLKSCPALRTASQGCLRMLSMRFKTTHAPPGDTLVHTGDLLTALYFITRGSIEILQNNVVVAVLRQGDIFGESKCCEANMGKSNGTVRALTYCDLHKIGRSDLLEVLNCYPEFSDYFWENLEITYNLRAEDPVSVNTHSKNTLLCSSSKSVSNPRDSEVGEDAICRMASMDGDSIFQPSHAIDLSPEKAGCDVTPLNMEFNKKEVTCDFYGSCLGAGGDPDQASSRFRPSNQSVVLNAPTNDAHQNVGGIHRSHMTMETCLSASSSTVIPPVITVTKSPSPPGDASEGIPETFCSCCKTVQERVTSLEKEICQMKTKMENDLHKILELLQAKSETPLCPVSLPISGTSCVERGAQPRHKPTEKGRKNDKRTGENVAEKSLFSTEPAYPYQLVDERQGLLGDESKSFN
ncbi:voltage-gated inwardly rectifying potassium channel KCNH6-like isoform X2 [Clavelina lepadiformis]|uniref:voltage-gated inwardly rectifying potassium channel KCNH6-like isoform X2 n=1 Tax=Clavelina lepadiformis TaxID=159417 RepID=UPI004041D299